jgi:type VI secretion system secreted protein VgrG
MAIYGSGIFYGSGAKYIGAASSADQGIPVDLRFYRTSQDGVYVFWWGFNPAFITPALPLVGFDLELDTVPTFNSPNFITFDATSAITFQNGNVRKGFAVPVAARINGVVQTWYARVRTHTPSFISGWSHILTWTIPQSVQQSSAEALMESLPDFHVYGKGDLLKPVADRNTNLWQVEDMYGNQLDQVFYANYLTQTNNYVDLAIDEVLYQNFGVLFDFPKPSQMQYVDYRWILMNLYLASLVGSTNEAIILIAEAFTGVPPSLTNVRDANNFILGTILDAPITPTSPQSQFFTSSPFTSELVVVDVTQSSGNPYLLSASSFAVLGKTAVTNTGFTVLTGDLGVSPGSSITGFPPGTFTGFLHSGDLVAAQAHADATAAAIALQAMGPGTNISSTDLNGFVATPGVYSAAAAGTWTATGNLTLNGAGTYVFLFGTSLTVGANCNVILTNGATADNVYFVTGTTFTFGANDTINGNILAGTSITFASNSILNGRALCYGPSGTTVTFPSAGIVTVPASVVVGAGLIVPPSSYTSNGVQGYWTMNVPTTHTLQAMFDTAPPIKIFDALSGATVLTGTTTFTHGSNTITGVGTSYLSQLVVGQQITDPTGIYLAYVSSVVSNTSVVLSEGWAGPTESVVAYRLQYTDTQLPIPILWDKSTLAFGIIITIFDPGHFVLPFAAAMEKLINQLVPAMVKTYFNIVEV